MALLDDLRNTLQTRFDSNQPVFYAQDLGQPGEQDFIDILGVNELVFTSPQLGQVQDGKLNITGKVSALGLEALDFDLVVEERENEDYGQYLVFTLIPQLPLPETWEFSQSFHNLEGTYFDNLVLSNAYLVATSYEHDIAAPAITLSKGINFSACAAPEQALKSIKSLCPSVSLITLQGMVTRNEDIYGVNLTASINDAPIVIQAPFLLSLEHIPTKGNEQNPADFEGTITAQDDLFPYSITIPTTVDSLDELQSILEAGIQNGNLEFRDSDLGTDTSEDFFTYLGVHALELTEASIERQGPQLIVSGKTSIYSMPDDTQVQIIVVENNEKLDFTVMPLSFPEDWKLSQSFAQVAGSFFDGLQLSDTMLAATSYVHQMTAADIVLAEGINFYARTTSDGSLERLKELGDTFDNGFPIQGTITPKDALYEIVLSYNETADINVNLVDFGTAAIKQPVAYFESTPSEDSQSAANSAYIGGTVYLPPFETYRGRLIIPANDDQVNWKLHKENDYLNLPSISSLIAFFGQEKLASVFPQSFEALEDILISKFNAEFLLGDCPTASFYAEAALKPDQDGTPRSWEILSSPQLAVGNLKFGINVSYYTYDTDMVQMVFSCVFSGSISIGSTANLQISMLIPLQGDWELTVSSENAMLPSLNDIAGFIWPGGGHSDDDLLAPLPQGLVKSDLAIMISEIKIGFNPFTPSLSFFSFKLEQEGQWQIIANILSVSGWSVAMNIDMKESVNITGLLHGFITIGSGDQAIADIEATLPIPADQNGWTLSLVEGTAIDVPSLGELLALIGGKQFADGIPENLQNIGGLTVDLLEINFVPVPPKMNWFTFAMKSRGDWVVIENMLSVQNIETNLDIRQGENERYNTKGKISGTVFIFNKPLWIMAGRDNTSEAWMLKLATAQTIHIPGLAQLAAWMLPESMLAYIPVEFMPFGQGFDLTDLNIGFDLSNMNLQKIYFHINNSEAWQVIPGYQYISLDKVIAEADIENPFLANQELTCHIEGTINLGDFAVTLSADKATPQAEWVLTGQLAEQAELNFEDLFRAILPASLPMPYQYGFPSAVTITSASVTVIPQKWELHFQASSITDWQLNFALIVLSINSINAKLDLESANDADKRLYTLAADGNVTFCGLSADLFFYTGNKPAVDTVLSAVITPEQVVNISLPDISDTLTTTEASGDKWLTLVPADIVQLAFAQGYIHINLTQNEFFIYGNVTGFGSIVFLTKELADQSWGYLFALALGPDFAFGNLFSSLAVIDNILTVNNAGIFLSSFEDSSTELMADIKLVADFPEKPADFTLPLPIENLPEKQLQKGIYFYSDMDFPAMSLFGNILQIGDIAAGVSNIIVSAFIAKDNSLNTVFMADLPDITIFDTIIFTHTNIYPGIHLQYTAKDGKENEFQLIGRINLSLFSSLYSFDGYLTVNTENIDSQLQLAADSAAVEIPMPFGLPGICFTDLYMGVKYIFAKDNMPVSCSLLIGGSVSFGEALAFSSWLQLKEAAPVLAVIQLDKNLSIVQFFAQCVNVQWPDSFFDITFLSGSKIYYYDESVDIGGQYGKDENNYNYLNGFNIDADIILTILIDIHIYLTARVIPDVNGTYKGIKINAAVSDAINLFVLQIAGTTMGSDGKYSGGPEFEVNTVDNPMTFGFGAGLNFFQEPFGMAEVKIRSMSGTGEMELLGHLESAQVFEPFGVLSLDFTYSQSEGFQIQGWQAFDMVSDVIDFVNQIKDICDALGETACGSLADMITDVVFQTTYNITPTFDTEGDKLYFVLNGQYYLNLLGVDEPFVTVNFPPCRFELPNDLSLSALPEEIIDSISNAATDFADALLDDPEQIAAFLAILFAEEAADIALKMACRGIIDAVTAEAAAAAGEAVAAAGGAIAAGAAAVGAAVAAVAAVFSCSSCFTEGTEVLLSDGTIKQIEDIKIGDTLLGKDNTINKVLKYDRPLLGSRELYSLNDGPYFVTSEHPLLTKAGWKSLKPEATAKENPNLSVGKLEIGDTLILADGKEAILKSINSKADLQDTQLYNFILEGSNTYYANRYLVHNKDESCFVGGTEVLLANGAGKPIEAISIGDMLLGQDGMHNKVLKYDRPLLGNRILYSFNYGPYFVTAEHPFMTKDGWKSVNPEAAARENPRLSVGRLQVGDTLITACGEEMTLESIREKTGSPDTQLYNFILEGNNTYYANGILTHNKDQMPETPDFKTLEYKNELVNADWKGAYYASGYQFQFIAPSGETYKDFDDIDLSTLKISFAVDESLPAGTCTGKVRSVHGSDKKSDWAQKTICKLNTPDGIQLSFRNNQLQAVWNAVTPPAGISDAISYEVRLMKDGNEFKTVQTQTPAAAFDINEAGAYTSQVRAVCGNGCIPSSCGTTKAEIIKLPEPEAVSVNYSNTAKAFTVTWSGVQNCSGYTVEITDEANGICACMDALASEISKIIPISLFTGSGGRYKASVCAKGTGIYIDSNFRISANTIEKLMMPAGIIQNYIKAADKLSVIWNRDTSINAVKYSLAIFDIITGAQAGSGIDVAITDGSAATIEQDIDMSPLLTSTAAQYRAQIQTIGSEAAVNSDAGISSNTTSQLAMPQNVTQNYTAGDQRLDVSWEAVQNAAGYMVMVTDVNNGGRIVASKAVDAAAGSTVCTFAKEDFTEVLNGVYQVQVKALGNEQTIDSAVGAGQNITVCNLIMPELTLVFTGVDTYGKIYVSWINSDPGSVTYNLILLDSNGNQVDNTINGAIDSAEFVMETPQDGIYTVMIQGKQEDYFTGWNSGKSIAVKVLAKPKNLRLNCNDDYCLNVVWDAVSGANSYKLQILDFVSVINTGWTESVSTAEWRQSFVSDIDGIVTNISFNRNSRPSTSYSPAVRGRMDLCDDTGKLLGSSSFLDENGSCSVDIRGKVSKGKSYTWNIVYDSEITVWYGIQAGLWLLPACAVQGLPYLDSQGTVPEKTSAANSTNIDLYTLEWNKSYYIQVMAAADSSEGPWSSQQTINLLAPMAQIAALIAGGAADSNGDGRGDNHSDQLPYTPALQSAAINSSGGNGCRGTCRYVSKWDISSLNGHIVDGASVALSTCKGSVDALDTYFYAVTADSDRILKDSDFELPVVQIPNARMRVPNVAVGTTGSFQFEVTDQLQNAVNNGQSIFTIQGRVDESLGTQQRGLQICTTCSSNSNNFLPMLLVKLHIAPISIVSGNHQSLERTHPEDIPGGFAYFAPLKVKVSDSLGNPLANTPVTFSVGAHPNAMAVDIGNDPVTCYTGSDGIAALAGQSGYSVRCYYAEGDFEIIAGISNGSKVIFNLNVAHTSPVPPLSNVTLSIVSGNMQHQKYCSDGIARFAPVTVRLLDSAGQPVAGAQVNFTPGEHPSNMAVQVHPSGGTPSTVITDNNGNATLNYMPDNTSVWCYYDKGQASVIASVAGGTQVTFIFYVDS